jgi:Fic family protein
MRRYEETHPWINFKANDFNDLNPRSWMLLGEARSKCQHLAGTPLRPEIAKEFYEVTLIKGAQATAAIEGNTLTEDQVAGIFYGTYKAPPSRAYQEREIRNMLDALMDIDRQIMRFEHPKITLDLIKNFNLRVLEGTDHEPHVVPGETRDYPVGVPSYLGAPAEDCEYLVAELCTWLESDLFSDGDPDIAFAKVIACAIYAHLYIAWIHPFGDGNGRTARLLEYLILARSGMVPLPAAHLLSNHYNLTRDQYYRELNEASRTRKVTDLIGYAVQGLVDGIREQIDKVRETQMRVTWINYVHETMGRFPSGPTRDRQRSLVLAMPHGDALPKAELPGLTPKLAAEYAKAGPRTLQRDLNRLEGAGLVAHRGPRWQSNDDVIRAFLPPIADPELAAWLSEK